MHEPQAVEEKWYDFWLKQNCFTANPKSLKPAYSIVIPPPTNVTGMLHMGHVLNNTIQDILSRKARMEWQGSALAPRHRPRRHRHADASGTRAQKRRAQNQIRSRPRGISETRLGLEGKARRHHHQPAQKAWLLLRLDPRTLHHGPGIFPLRPKGVRRALQKGLCSIAANAW